VDMAKGPPQPVFIGWNGDDVYMVRHQAIGPDRDMRARRRVRQKVQVKLIVPIFEERPFPAVAPLRYMVRDAGENNAGKAGHDGRLRYQCGLVKGLLHVSP
jgi:hypothetical protein